MSISSIVTLLLIYVPLLLGMAFFTLLERKGLGYFQIRKGPNKVGLMGLPQPFADAIKLFSKSMTKPASANTGPFLLSPLLSLILALMLWLLYPLSPPSYWIPLGALLFLCISSINVYSTLGSGWMSNSKYSLLGSLRSIAQTVSYEVSMALIILSPLILFMTMNLSKINSFFFMPIIILAPPLFLCWFATSLAETNRTPFDLAEGESELVSGFNTEYSGGTFSLIFMAEYLNIIMMSAMTVIFFFTLPMLLFPGLLPILTTFFIAFMFVWSRATLPRMRYDFLMQLTWKKFLPFSLIIYFPILIYTTFLW